RQGQVSGDYHPCTSGATSTCGRSTRWNAPKRLRRTPSPEKSPTPIPTRVYTEITAPSQHATYNKKIARLGVDRPNWCTIQRDPSNPPIPTSGPFPAIVIRSGDMMMACSPTGIRNAAHYIDIPNNWIRGSRWAVRVGIFALVACGDAAELPPSTTRTPRERTSKISSPLGPIQVHFAAATGSSRLCTLDDVIPHVALVGGAPVYVNAEVFSSSADRILLAGFPNYIWPTGAVEPVADSIFGIVVDSDGPATAVHKPIPCNLVNLVTVHRSGACS